MDSFGKKLRECREAKSLSQKDLAGILNTSYLVIGKYECNEMIPSIEVAKKIADTLGVTLDYLVGETSQVSFDKRTVDRIKDLEELEESKKQTLYDLIDAYIRDFKTRKTFSNI